MNSLTTSVRSVYSISCICKFAVKASICNASSSSQQLSFYSSSSSSMARSKKKHSPIGAEGFEQFFEKKEKIDEIVQIGRGWTVPDLRRKSFDDLHKLWFVMYKERNMLLSEREKARRMQLPVSKLDENRYIKIKRGMGAIKHVLRERSSIKRELELNNIMAEIIEQDNNDIDDDDSNNNSSNSSSSSNNSSNSNDNVDNAKITKLADTKPGGVSF